MRHIGELLGLEAAEVLGTASFYEMFKRHPVGKYVVNVCTSISCFLNGGDELLEHAEQRSASPRAARPTTGCSRSRATSASPRAPKRRACRSTTGTSTASRHDEFDRWSTTSALVGATTSRRTARCNARRQTIDPDRAAGVVGPDGAAQPVWIRDTPALQDSRSK